MLQAYKYSKMNIAINKHNHDNIIEITIENDNVIITQPTNNHTFKGREFNVKTFLQEVCNWVDSTINLKFNFNLDDSDLTKDINNSGIFAFSRPKDHEQILMPDMYAMGDYDKKLEYIDNMNWNNKYHKAIFIGSSTGNYNPEYNKRLQLCNYFLNHNDIKCYISHICQISENNIANTYPDYKNFMHNMLSIEKQLKYKFVISVDGNTTAWDRVPWILNSKSVLLKQKSNDECWYYDLLIPDVHFIEFDHPSEIIDIIANTTQEKYEYIVNNANNFVNDYLTFEKQRRYAAYLLYYCSIK